MVLKQRVTSASQKVILRVEEVAGASSRSRSDFLRLARNKVPMIGYLTLFFVLTGGIVNAIANSGDPGINSSPVVLNGGVQNFTETAINFILFAVGTFGSFAIYRSGRQRLRSRSAEMVFWRIAEGGSNQLSPKLHGVPS
jgi:hypothetical protein